MLTFVNGIADVNLSTVNNPSHVKKEASPQKGLVRAAFEQQAFEPWLAVQDL